MRLSHNMASLNIYREQSKVFEKQSSALGSISSGLKISKTKDSPNGIAQSERLRMQIRGNQMAARNAQDGISMLQTAEGAVGTINNMLIRIKELAVQAGSETNSPDDKAIIQQEISQMLQGIDDAANSMQFNGVKLLAPKVSELNMPIGANRGDNIKIELFDIRTSQIEDIDGNKLNLDKIDVTVDGGTDKTIQTLDKAIQKVLSARSKLGALENRFESSYKNLTEISDKMQGAESSIRDADIAEEMIEFSKGNILIEAGNALMAQTNRFPQDILRILENMRR